MSTEHALDAAAAAAGAAVPLLARSSVELHSGDRMSREEFHRLYEQTQEDFKAELIGGIVYVGSRVRVSHGEPHALLSAVLIAYASRTPGTEASDNTTVMLGDDGEPQPDLFLRVLPEYGGQSSTTPDDYVLGAPELIVEVAHSSQAIDLHAKKEMYAKYGGREYIVACLREKELRWFDLAAGNELSPDATGILRPSVFPGLWLNGPAIFALDYAPLMATLEQGLATPDHGAFVQQLTAAHANSK